jgi:superfamily II DNA or RNA helicase
MGVGKTLIGLKHMQMNYTATSRFLVVAPKKAVFKSWLKDAEEFGFTHLLDRVTFTTYLSLEKQDLDYDVVYLDECHSLLRSHEPYLSEYHGKILGLTGTPPRYKNSEKGEMVAKYCPIVYKYITDTAVEDRILNDYKIVVHCLKLDTALNHKVVKKDKKSFFMTSERKHYDYWTKRIDETFSQKQKSIFRIMRMKALMEYSSKESYAKHILSMMTDKCIVFANTTEQADRLCEYSYHSKNSSSEANLTAFEKDEIEQLSCVLQLNEGINVPNLRAGIILHAYSNERKSSQRIGRLLRLNPDDVATIHILMYQDCVDEQWVEEALKDFDQDKIVYVNPIY